MIIRFAPRATSDPPGKLADVELHFDAGDLAGLKLIGFALWQRKTGGLNVTWPSRQYVVNGERRAFALLRAIEQAEGLDRLRDLITNEWRSNTCHFPPDTKEIS